MKVSALSEAIALIERGSSVAFGGNTMHRVPVAAVKELVGQNKNISMIKSAGSLEVDVLCAAGLAQELTFAYVGYENFGLAPFFRQAVEHGQTVVHEHT